MKTPLLAMENVERIFGGGRTLFGTQLPSVHAVQGVTLDIARGETLGIVGESGCGKSTLARLLVGLDAPTGGTITFDGHDLVALAKADHRAIARKIQYVFQDPQASLNPRKTIRATLEAPLIHGLSIAIPERDLEAFAQQPCGGSATDATSGARHDRDPCARRAHNSSRSAIRARCIVASPSVSSFDLARLK
jgi:ABC-type glutathione transport system ATPase component